MKTKSRPLKFALLKPVVHSCKLRLMKVISLEVPTLGGPALPMQTLKPSTRMLFITLAFVAVPVVPSPPMMMRASPVALLLSINLAPAASKVKSKPPSA